MIKTKITAKRVKDHFAYASWKYLILAIVAIFGWNLVYTTTAYRPPKEKKVDVYFVTSAVSQDTLDLLEQLAAPMFPDMEEINFLSIAMNTEDDYYANMQLTTYVGAQEGDIYIMSKDRYRAYAYSGAFLPLDEAIASGEIDLRGIDASTAYTSFEEGGGGICGIPASSLYGMMAYNIDNRSLYMGVTAYSKNVPNAVKMVDWFIENMQAERPEWLDALEEREKKNQVAAPQAVIPSY